jgi:hypothetical protein
MGLNFKTVRKVSENAIGTASLGVVVGPIDVRNFDEFSVVYQNNNTAIGFLNMSVQACPGDQPFTSAVNAAPNWVTLSTAILEVPSALGPTASFRSSRVDNVYGYIRILGQTSATASVGTFQVVVEGKQIY